MRGIVRLRAFALVVCISLLLLSGCKPAGEATISVNGDPAAKVVAFGEISSDPSEYSFRLQNLSGKEAKLELAIYSVGASDKWDHRKTTSKTTTGSTDTITLKAYKGTCFGVVASIKFGKAKPRTLEKKFSEACWKSPLDA